MMSTRNNGLPARLIVLRQVEGSRWCVVEHVIQNGKRQFVGRIATAREYGPACMAGLEAAQRQRLPFGIEANGQRLRRFDADRDMPRRPFRPHVEGF
jgi:hypothetical protein